MRRRVALTALLAGLLTLLLTAGALGSIYRGAGSDDPEMPVKLTITGADVTFVYSDVLAVCTAGEQVRQGGAIHHARLNDLGRFKDAFTRDATTSSVRGKVIGRRAIGTLSYDFVYEGGECHADKVPWKARRKGTAARPPDFG